MMRFVAAVVVAALMIGACGDDGPMTVADATDADRAVAVMGFVLQYDDGRVVMADALAESFPPQPGGATIEVTGLDPSGFVLTTATAGETGVVGWTETPVTVSGTMNGGVLRAG